MRKWIRCQHCPMLINQAMPRVTPPEADELRAADRDEGCLFKCPGYEPFELASIVLESPTDGAAEFTAEGGYRWKPSDN